MCAAQVALQPPVAYARLAAQCYIDAPTYGSADGSGRAHVYGGDVVAFRGTDDLATWLADLDVATVQVPELGELHAGFWGAFSTIAGDLMHLAPRVVCGHSEGAALAILYAGELCRAGRPPSAVFGFEPPRVSCDAALGQLLQAHGVEVYLTQNGNDVVPMVPRLTRPWRHPAPLRAIGKATLPWPNVEDHEIARVIAALMQIEQVA